MLIHDAKAPCKGQKQSLRDKSENEQGIWGIHNKLSNNSPISQPSSWASGTLFPPDWVVMCWLALISAAKMHRLLTAQAARYEWVDRSKNILDQQRGINRVDYYLTWEWILYFLSGLFLDFRLCYVVCINNHSCCQIHRHELRMTLQ